MWTVPFSPLDRGTVHGGPSPRLLGTVASCGVRHPHSSGTAQVSHLVPWSSRGNWREQKKASNLREGESRPLSNGDIAGGSPSHFPKKVRYVRLTGRSSGSRVILLTTPSHSPYGEQWQSVAFVTGHSGGSAPLRLTHASRSDFPISSAAGAKPPINRVSRSGLIPRSQDRPN